MLLSQLLIFAVMVMVTGVIAVLMSTISELLNALRDKQPERVGLRAALVIINISLLMVLIFSMMTALIALGKAAISIVDIIP